LPRVTGGSIVQALCKSAARAFCGITDEASLAASPIGRAVVPPLQSVAPDCWTAVGKHRFVPVPAELVSGVCGVRNSSTGHINPLLSVTHDRTPHDHSDTARSRSVTCVTHPIKLCLIEPTLYATDALGARLLILYGRQLAVPRIMGPTSDFPNHHRATCEQKVSSFR
jgi:hypothetical protein